MNNLSEEQNKYIVLLTIYLMYIHTNFSKTHIIWNFRPQNHSQSSCPQVSATTSKLFYRVK